MGPPSCKVLYISHSLLCTLYKYLTELHNFWVEGRRHDLVQHLLRLGAGLVESGLPHSIVDQLGHIHVLLCEAGLLDSHGSRAGQGGLECLDRNCLIFNSLTTGSVFHNNRLAPLGG